MIFYLLDVFFNKRQDILLLNIWQKTRELIYLLTDQL